MHNSSVPRKNPLPKRELAICSRVKQVRLAQGCPRAYLATLIKVDRYVLTRLELGRAPLRYGLAEQFCSALKVNPLWLATGEGDINLAIPLPEASFLKVNANALFSKVFDSLLASYFIPGNDKSGWVGSGLDPETARVLLRGFFNTVIDEWVTMVREDTLALFVQEIQVQSRKLYSSLPLNRWQTTLIRRLEHMHEARPPAILKTQLTETSQKRRTGIEMKSEFSLKALLADLKTATKSRGKKAELAKRFKISQASLSEWLRGKKEPGGDITLQLLNWVENSKR